MNEEKKKVSAISLGCDKNRVDLEKMLFALREDGYEIVEEPTEANVVIVNTCAFITPSKRESISQIFDMCLLKKRGKLEKVVVTGCMSQRHKDELIAQMPEVDAFLTASENEKICEIVDGLFARQSSAKKKMNFGRVFTSEGAYAYLKIADGCSNACSFCTIPRIKGRYVSEPFEKLIDEAKTLAKSGVKEIILVAQDVTRYGEERYKKNRLIELCREIAKIDGIKWIRLHYAYPEKTTKQLVDFILSEPKMCKYLDIPLQHIDDSILSSMRRKSGEAETRELVKMLKSKPLALRTTFIVGYPGETRAQFASLCNFLKESQFDYAGFFPYYREENTPSFYLERQKSSITKKRRLAKVQKIQNAIATNLARQKMGKVFTVLVDTFDSSDGNFIGHTEFLSPTVDFGVNFVDNGKVKVGDFVSVKFFDFDGENYKGEIYEPSK